jgi:hypothetical protein
MSQAQVRDLMGEDPGKIVRMSDALEIWYYDYPSGGHIQFAKGLVESWSEP